MKITIQRALNEITLLNKRIESLVSSIKAVDLIKKNKSITELSGISPADFAKQSKANLQAIQDLIARRTEIKNKILKANNEILVKINNKQLTITQLLSEKIFMEDKRNLLQNLKKDLSYTKENYDSYCRLATEKAERMIPTAKNERGKNDSIETYKSIVALETPEFLNPNKIETYIEKLSKEVEDFFFEINFVLAEANNTNYIEISD